MTNSFTAILTWVTDHLAPFFIAEPVVYFTGAFLLVFVIELVARLIHRDF